MKNRETAAGTRGRSNSGVWQLRGRITKNTSSEPEGGERGKNHLHQNPSTDASGGGIKKKPDQGKKKARRAIQKRGTKKTPQLHVG